MMAWTTMSLSLSLCFLIVVVLASVGRAATLDEDLEQITLGIQDILRRVMTSMPQGMATPWPAVQARLHTLVPSIERDVIFQTLAPTIHAILQCEASSLGVNQTGLPVVIETLAFA